MPGTSEPRSGGPSAASQAAEAWRARGLDPAEHELGTVFGVEGKVLDTRRLLLTTGRFDSEAAARREADALVRELLAGLPAQAGCAPLPPVPEVQPLTAARQIDIPFQSAQAHVLIGQPGYPRSDPDHLALTLGNYILGGGGFVSRLTTQVREKRGLSYSVYSHFSPGLHAGAFTVSLQTRPDQAAEAVAVARQVLADFVAGGPTDAEVKAAQDNLVNGFPLLLDSNAKLLGNVANIAWNNLPLDYLDTWTARMQRITAADIKAAFARKLDPQRMVTVVVGAQPAGG